MGGDPAHGFVGFGSSMNFGARLARATCEPRSTPRFGGNGAGPRLQHHTGATLATDPRWAFTASTQRLSRPLNSGACNGGGDSDDALRIRIAIAL